MNTMFAELSSDGNLNLIEAVKWSDLIADYQNYVDKAVDRQDYIDEYDIFKEV